MTVIRPSSISGINSITGNGGDINLFRADGTKADVPIVNNITAGVVTATKFVGPIEGNVTGIVIVITTPTEELHIRAATPVIRLEDGDNARQSQIVG